MEIVPPTSIDLKDAKVEKRRPVVVAVIETEFECAAGLLDPAELVLGETLVRKSSPGAGKCGVVREYRGVDERVLVAFELDVQSREIESRLVGCRLDLQCPKVVPFGVYWFAPHQVGVSQRPMDLGVSGVEALGEQEFAKAERDAVLADVVDPEIEV